MLKARALLFALLFVSPLTLAAQSEKFEVVKVADGVYAALRKDAPGFAVESNSVFIIRDDGVVVVDAQSNTATTQLVLAALRKLTDKPVKYVINTHWHDDHIIGNQVYRDAFPNVEFIGHANSRAYLPTTGMTNRKKFHEGIPGVVKQFSEALKNNKNLRGEPLTEEERASLESDLSLAQGYMTVPDGFQPILPTITVEDKLVLYGGGRTIEILYLGRAHTSGDLVINLPTEHVVIAGDTIVWPVPFVGADQSHVGDWSATLEKLRALQPAVIIPGHGPLMRDDSYVRMERDLFASIKKQVDEAVARGATLEETRKSVNLDEFRKLFAGDSKVRNALFSVYVVGPAVASAFHDATEKR
jgi:cyclase